MSKKLFLSKENNVIHLGANTTYTLTNSSHPQAVQTPNIILLSDLPTDDVEIIITDDTQKVRFEVVGDSPILRINPLNRAPSILSFRRNLPYHLYANNHRNLYIPSLKDGILTFCIVQIEYTAEKQLLLKLL